MEKIKVIVADDHSLIRQGICKVLELDSSLIVVGEATNGAELLDIIGQVGADIVLLDINMPGENGIQLTRFLKKKYNGIKIIILTIHDDDDYIFEAYNAGASGYILKDVDPDELIEAIKTVYSGIPYIHPSITGKLLNVLNRVQDQENNSHNRYRLLSEREMEVLTLLASGQSNRQIAQQLFISEKTVKNHISSIFRKMEVRDRTQAAVLAIKDGIV
jgi:two-component system response regulator DegU